MSALYTTSFLPYGRFYHSIGGNSAMLYSYMFVFIYLSCTSLRNPVFIQLKAHNLMNKSLKLVLGNSKKVTNLLPLTNGKTIDTLSK